MQTHIPPVPPEWIKQRNEKIALAIERTTYKITSIVRSLLGPERNPVLYARERTEYKIDGLESDDYIAVCNEIETFLIGTRHKGRFIKELLEADNDPNKQTTIVNNYLTGTGLEAGFFGEIRTANSPEELKAITGKYATGFIPNIEGTEKILKVIKGFIAINAFYSLKDALKPLPPSPAMETAEDMPRALGL